jgi:hypothetical protein
MDLTHDEIVLLIDALRIRSFFLGRSKAFIAPMVKGLKSFSKSEIDDSINKNEILCSKLVNLVFKDNNVI